MNKLKCSVLLLLRNVLSLKVFLLFISVNSGFADITVCSWNLKDFGSSKDEGEIRFIANVIKEFDIIAIQEVVAKDLGGAQAVARLHDQLNRMDYKWDYVVSNPTSGNNSYKKERYAFIWKTNKAQRIGDPWLEKEREAEIDREPFYITFMVEGSLITVSNFHAISKSMQPESEIKYFRFFPEQYVGKNIIFCGDFNLPQSHTVFNPLKELNYLPILAGQKTSLKQECVLSDCLASEFDNIFYNVTKVGYIESGIIHFYKEFATLKEAVKISDHVPVYFRFSILK